jgi:MoaA/NifB/PqqE/SkfB family radical SAM enzyme
MGLDVLLSITDLCNARCVMCNVWRNKDQGKSFLPPALMETVRPLSSVSLAGGEPFLHREIVALVEKIHAVNPKAKVIFSTNGFNTERIVAEVARILAFHRNTQVTISLDGVGEMHDRIRGIPGAWEKVNRTFDRLGEIGLRQRNFAFTVSEQNVAELPRVYQHVRGKGAGLSLAVAQSSKYLKVEIPPMPAERLYPQLNPILEDHLRSARPLDWARAFFFYGLLRYLASGRRLLPCDALERQLMIDQTGTVFSCHPLMLAAGTLEERTFPAILADEPAAELRPQLRECHACWEVCTARSSIRRDWWRVGLWILWNKPLAHLRLRNGSGASRLFPESEAAPRGRGGRESGSEPRGDGA